MNFIEGATPFREVGVGMGLYDLSISKILPLDMFTSNDRLYFLSCNSVIRFSCDDKNWISQV